MFGLSFLDQSVKCLLSIGGAWWRLQIFIISCCWCCHYFLVDTATRLVTTSSSTSTSISLFKDDRVCAALGLDRIIRCHLLVQQVVMVMLISTINVWWHHPLHAWVLLMLLLSSSCWCCLRVLVVLVAGTWGREDLTQIVFTTDVIGVVYHRQPGGGTKFSYCNIILIILAASNYNRSLLLFKGCFLRMILICLLG